MQSNQNHLPRGWPIRELTRQYLSNSVSHDKRQQDEPATRDEWGRSHENKKLRKIANVTQNSPVNTKMKWWTRPSSTTGDERHAKEGGEEDGRTRGAAEEGKGGKGGDAQRRPKEADTRRRKAEEAGVWRKAKEPASKGEPRDRELKEGTWVMEVSGGMEEWGLDMRRSRSLGMDTTILEARKSSEERDRDDVDKSERNTREARKGGGGIGIEESDSDKEVASPVQRRRKRTPFVGDYEDEDGDDSKTAVASPCGETNVQEVSKTNGWPYPLDSSSLPKRFVALSEQLLVFFNSSKDLHLQAS
ncbi:hypothetical protein APHAL10511_000421 [Amanita phalloides]|nr:hypothetical protein APHAL10511_000421 [Amanita phalloides]